ncbi:MAG: efflux RND transporter periplasmic adaptor subunit [Betaproteobacteria bacterium]|nr:MAG: efflux RND transporter periplasmic adaptor subunit [Betaproteobacteria bacterium]
MTNRAKWWTVLGVAGLAVVIGVAAFAAARRKAEADAAKKIERPPLEFTQRDLVQLQPHRIAVQWVVPGTVQAVSQATVRAKLAAEVKRVLVREGERVASGQVVAEFDTAPMRAQLAERAAALDSARAQLSTTERTRQTNAKLVKQNFISQNAFDAADSAHQAQLAAVAMAQAQLEQSQLQLNDAVVRSPIAGMVAKRHVQPGEKVGFDAPLVAIVDLSQLEVQAQASVGDIAGIQAGMPAEVDIEGLPERKFAGRVERINPSAEPGTRTINVYVALRNDEALLRTGMFARVHLSRVPQHESPTLPLSALRGDHGQHHVWVLEGGKLLRRTVVAGARDERAQRVEIASGLNARELVIATKFDNLQDGLAARLAGAQPGATVAEREAPKPAAATN